MWGSKLCLSQGRSPTQPWMGVGLHHGAVRDTQTHGCAHLRSYIVPAYPSLILFHHSDGLLGIHTCNKMASGIRLDEALACLRPSKADPADGLWVISFFFFWITGGPMAYEAEPELDECRDAIAGDWVREHCLHPRCWIIVEMVQMATSLCERWAGAAGRGLQAINNRGSRRSDKPNNCANSILYTLHLQTVGLR